jgi:hypothetical protein
MLLLSLNVRPRGGEAYAAPESGIFYGRMVRRPLWVEPCEQWGE